MRQPVQTACRPCKIRVCPRFRVGATVSLPIAVQLMTRPVDSVLLVLFGLLLASLSAFFLGIIPYPYGLLVLAAFITARILHLLSNRK